MNTLFNVKYNPNLLLGIALLIFLLFPELKWYSFIALIITLHQFFLLFYSIGHIIPIRYLFGSLMCLQLFLGPVLAYNGMDQFQTGNSKMQIPESEYFLYVLPAVVAFIAGLHSWSKNLKGEILDLASIKAFTGSNNEIAYFLIGVGFFSGLVTDIFSSDLAFVFYLLDSFKFIGLFLLIVGSDSLKIIPMSIVLGSIIISSLNQGMFHDLLIWVIFLFAILAIRYQPKIYIKLIFMVAFGILAVTIQLVKGDYREATWGRGEETELNTLTKAYEQTRAENKFFNYSSIAQSNLRINQGYIITHIMKTVPKKVPYANGAELNDILISALLPRFLMPGKLTAGNRDIFMKYTKFQLKKSVSMGLSSVGDAYINFGVIGGCVFMFLLGLFYSEVLKGFNRYSKSFPILLLFTPMVFYYAVRPDSELQTNLGHMVKSCFLIFLIFQFWKSKLKIQIFSNWRRSLS